MRLFLAIDLSPEARRALAHAVSWMRAYEDRVRVVPPENFHLTLKFLGSVREEDLAAVREAAHQAACSVGACALRLSGWGAFPEKGHPSVFWTAVEPAASLKPLFESCETLFEPLGFKRETRAALPHVTLARTGERHAPADFLMKWKALPPLSEPAVFRAERLVLYESRTEPAGPVYRRLVHWALGSGAAEE